MPSAFVGAPFFSFHQAPLFSFHQGPLLRSIMAPPFFVPSGPPFFVPSRPPFFHSIRALHINLFWHSEIRISLKDDSSDYRYIILFVKTKNVKMNGQFFQYILMKNILSTMTKVCLFRFTVPLTNTEKGQRSCCEKAANF